MPYCINLIVYIFFAFEIDCFWLVFIFDLASYPPEMDITDIFFNKISIPFLVYLI